MPDILITPSSPTYRLTAQSLLGLEWLEKYCISRTAYSLYDIRQLIARMRLQSISHNVNWSHVLETIT